MHYPHRKLAALLAAFSLISAGFLAKATAADDGPSPLRVLFVGNSLTFYNDLPTMVERLAAASGVARPLEAEMVARGGDSFASHTERRDDGAPLAVIARGGWDFVVLQENGRFAARSGIDSFPFASRLVRAARAAGAKPIFYMTWAYRGQPGTLPRIRDTYAKLGSRLEVPVAPVGETWALAGETAAEIDLFDPDGVHPSPGGSYLAACVIFSLLYQRPPAPPNGDSLGVAEDDARRLQEIASRALASYRQPLEHQHQPPPR